MISRSVCAVALSLLAVACSQHRTTTANASGPLPPVKLCIPGAPLETKTSLSVLANQELALGAGATRSGNAGPPSGIALRAWSHDSKRLAVLNGSGILSMWDTTTGKLLSMRAAVTPLAEQMVWSKSDDAIAVADASGAARFSLDDTPPSFVFTNESYYQRPVWNDDASLLLTTSKTAPPAIVDGQSGDLIRSLKSPASIYSKAVTTTSLGLLMTSDLNGQNVLWNWSTGAPISSFMASNARPIKTFASTRDRRWVAVTGEATIHVIDPASSSLAATITLDEIDERSRTEITSHNALCAWSRDRGTLAVVPYKQHSSVYVVDLRKPSSQAVAHFDGPESVRELVLSDDNRSVTVRGLPSAETTRKLGRKAMIEQTWNLDALSAQPVLSHNEAPRKTPPATKDPSRSISASKANKANKANKKHLHTKPATTATTEGAISDPIEIVDSALVSRLLGSEPLSPCLEDISPDGSMIAIDIGTSISVRDLSTGKERFGIRSRSVSVGGIRDFQPIPTGEPIFAANTSSHGTFILDRGELTMLPRPTVPEQMSWQPEGKAVAAMGPGWLQIWSRADHWSVRSFEHESPADRVVRRMIWAKSGVIATLVVDGAMADLEVWDSEKGWLSKLTSYEAEMAETSAAMRFGKDGLLHIGVGAVVESWDSRIGKQVASRTYAVERIKGIAPDSSRLIAETTEGLVVIDRATGATIAKLADPGATKNQLGKRSITWSADGARVSGVIGETGGWRARAWRVADGRLLAEISGGGSVPRTRWLASGEDLAVTANDGLEIHHLADCSKVELTPINVDGSEHLVIEGPDGRFDASDAALEVLALTLRDAERPRRILLGDLLRSRRQPNLWPPAPQAR